MREDTAMDGGRRQCERNQIEVHAGGDILAQALVQQGNGPVGPIRRRYRQLRHATESELRAQMVDRHRFAIFDERADAVDVGSPFLHAGKIRRNPLVAGIQIRHALTTPFGDVAWHFHFKTRLEGVENGQYAIHTVGRVHVERIQLDEAVFELGVIEQPSQNHGRPGWIRPRRTVRRRRHLQIVHTHLSRLERVVAVVLEPAPFLMSRLRRTPEGDVVARPIFFGGVDVREMVFGELVHIHLRLHIGVLGGIGQVVVLDVGPQCKKRGVAAFIHIGVAFQQIHRFRSDILISGDVMLVLTLTKIMDAPIHAVDVHDRWSVGATVHIHEFLEQILGEGVAEEGAHLVVGRAAQVEGLIALHRAVREQRIFERSFAIDAARMQREGFLRIAGPRTSAHDLDAGDLVQSHGAIRFKKLHIRRTFPITVHISWCRVAGTGDSVGSGHIDAVRVTEHPVRIGHDRKHR